MSLMHPTRTSLRALLPIIHRKSFEFRKVSSLNHVLSRNFASQEPQEELVVKEKIQIVKPSVVKWKRPPFVKNLFKGKFDIELLAFPEILDNESLAEVEKYVKQLNNFYSTKVDSRKIDETGVIPEDTLQDLKDMGLFGRMIPSKYGGLDLSYTACTRLNEVLGLDWSIYSMLTAHEFLASRIILLYGSEEQKEKYLPRLASGKSIAAVCYSEVESGCDLMSTRTSATQNSEDSFVIEGTKCWATNAEIADIFVVFAKTLNIVNSEEMELSVFIVEKNDDVIITPQEKASLCGAKTSMVHFKGVQVPVQNLISERGRGYEMYVKVMEDFKIAMNSFTFGTLKVLLDSLTEKIINTERLGDSIADCQLVRTRFGRIASTLYAMESMAYFTAAILDSTENPDISLESTILKIFNTSGTLYCLREMMELLGSSSLMKDQHLERFYRDAQGLYFFDGPNDIAKLFVAMVGLQAAGPVMQDEIRKLRNPFYFPFDKIKNIWRKIKIFKFRTKYDQDLAGHMHPSLVTWGNALEEKLQKFEMAVEEVLANHGREVIYTQIEPVKLANAATYLYAMSSVLSRCSRSYCIGLKNSQHEVRLAGLFCYYADKKIFNELSDIFIGTVRSHEGDHLLVGEQIIDCRGYFPENPLKHNF